MELTTLRFWRNIFSLLRPCALDGLPQGIYIINGMKFVAPRR